MPGFKVNVVHRRDRYLRGGDHMPFLERGFAALRFSEPNEDFAHQHQNVRKEGAMQYGDLPEFNDYNYIAQVARVNARGAGLAGAGAGRAAAGADAHRQAGEQFHAGLAAEHRAGPGRLPHRVARDHRRPVAGFACTSAT